MLKRYTSIYFRNLKSRIKKKNKIIPLLDTYPLKGTKYYDYLNWRDCFIVFLFNKDLNSRIDLIERIKFKKSKLNNLKLDF